ncbi:MAG: glycosyl transferase family 2 [Mesorhizobium sp. SCN 65-12]|nr:MAG: glycosyl transferase family 2 [Mesorhizobium sp. SCN 65-12]
MKLSVIMPVYNRAPLVGAALRSLLRQQDEADLDIIVIDDGSSDGSADVVREFGRQTSRIRLFQQPNGGVARARNAGLEQLLPQTELVSYLDSDDISPVGRFKTDLGLFDTNAGLELAYSRMKQVETMDDEALQPAAGSRYRVVRGISMSAGIFSRGLVQRTGPFDETFRQAEDTDYLLRVFETSPRHVLPDTIAVYYRQHPGNITRQSETALREHLRALHKSMRRRRHDPSLRDVQGIFEIVDESRWDGPKLAREDRAGPIA